MTQKLSEACGLFLVLPSLLLRIILFFTMCKVRNFLLTLQGPFVTMFCNGGAVLLSLCNHFLDSHWASLDQSLAIVCPFIVSKISKTSLPILQIFDFYLRHSKSSFFWLKNFNSFRNERKMVASLFASSLHCKATRVKNYFAAQISQPIRIVIHKH